MNSIEQDEAIRKLEKRCVAQRVMNEAFMHRIEQLEALEKHRIIVRDGIAYFADGSGPITEHSVT